jgi:hypothetical protein
MILSPLHLNGFLTKRFLHFNLVSSAVLWALQINRNNLVFNNVVWLNIKNVWRLVLSFLKDWNVPFKGKKQPVHGLDAEEAQNSTTSAREMNL